jgi:hypothetical protein
LGKSNRYEIGAFEIGAYLFNYFENGQAAMHGECKGGRRKEARYLSLCRFKSPTRADRRHRAGGRPKLQAPKVIASGIEDSQSMTSGADSQRKRR